MVSVRRVSGGAQHSMCVVARGVAFAWGDATGGKLGVKRPQDEERLGCEWKVVGTGGRQAEATGRGKPRLGCEVHSETLSQLLSGGRTRISPDEFAACCLRDLRADSFIEAGGVFGIIFSVDGPEPHCGTCAAFVLSPVRDFLILCACSIDNR